jgi:hypothetical protein
MFAPWQNPGPNALTAYNPDKQQRPAPESENYAVKRSDLTRSSDRHPR